MTPLHPSMVIGLRDGESPMSFCSRMAKLFNRTARDFCRDMGLSFQDIVDGNRQALRHLALRCRADFDQLTMLSITKVAPRRYRFGDQDLVLDTLSRATMRVCAHCLLADMEKRKEVEQLRPYGRTAWLIAPLRTCPLHNTALIEVADDQHPQRVHDFALLVAPSLQGLAKIGERQQPRHPSDFENYLAERLLSGAKGHSWLEELPFYAAAKVCEVIGAVATRGIRFRADDLTESDWHAAAAVGFKVASSGEEGIKSLLSRLQDSFPKTKHDWGPRSIFGRLYEWLAHESEDTAYDPLRGIIRNHVVETMPIGPGEEIFGEQVQARRLHSVRSASLEFEVHPKRLRKLLHAAGYIRPEDIALTDERIVFDAQRTRDFLPRVADAMSLNEAGAYINAPRPYERLLFDAGFIEPFIRGGTDALNKHAIAKQDLDAFLDQLLEGVHDVEQGDCSLCSIPDAGRRANCSAVEIVRLILDRTLQHLRRQPDQRGFLSILVDPDEVKRHVRGPELQGLKLRDVELKMRTSSAAVKALIDNNHLPSGVAVNPVNRCPQRFVKDSDLQRFMQQFASIDTLARERRTRGKNLRLKLEALGVAPKFVLSEIDLPFYDRRTIPEHFSDV